MIKKHFFSVVYGLVLTAFTVYVLLNTFVLEQVYTPAVPKNDTPPVESKEETTDSNAGETEIPAEEKEPVITDTTYSDGNIEIKITQHREFDTDIYVADIKLSSAEYLKTALAKDMFGKNITAKTSETAEDNNAVFAVNGDFYGAQEEGYVLKNGILYRSSAAKKQEDLVIYPDGSFEVIVETEVSAESLYENGAVQILSFGPSLIVDGRITSSANITRGAAKKDNPRTAIGILEDLHYVFVVCDGRTDSSQGLTIDELAVFMKKRGATTAYNLDGGGSATMYFNGNIINKPTFNGKDFKERKVSDIVYIGY